MIASGEYLRAFWWFVLPVPLFGALAFMFGGTQIMKGVGLFAILWPLSIPARAVLATSKAGRLFENGVHLSADDENLYFHGVDGSGLRLRIDSVRDAVRRPGFVVLRLRSLGFVPVLESALDAPDEFIRLFGRSG